MADMVADADALLHFVRCSVDVHRTEERTDVVTKHVRGRSKTHTMTATRQR